MSEKKTNQTRREREAGQRTNQILDAAVRLFAAKGFHRTTTRDIAEEAEVSEGTLYNYFANKDDLLLAIMRRLSDSFDNDSKTQDNLPAETRQVFPALLHFRQHFKEQNTAMMVALLSEIMANSGLRERYYKQLMEPALQELEESLNAQKRLGQTNVTRIPETARVMASVIIGLFFLEVLGDPIAMSEVNQLENVTHSVLLDGIAPKINQG